jgi:hypothetical protein
MIKHMPKISAFYFMWNPEICQDPPTCGQDDLVLYPKFAPALKSVKNCPKHHPQDQGLQGTQDQQMHEVCKIIYLPNNQMPN